MPVIEKHNYQPIRLLRNGHFNTIFPYLFRKDLDIPYERIRLDTPDQDFIDIDTIMLGNRRMVMLCHGLEGSSNSKYIQYAATLLSQSGWDVIAVNYRGCSGETNRKLQMYHSGFTQDIHMLLDLYQSKYDEIALVGYSLGGNLIMKYIGDGRYNYSDKIKCVVGISVPCDLKAGAIHIGKWQNYFYEKKFLDSLSEKIRIKKQLFPEKVDTRPLNKIKKLYDFDDLYTAPIHGFKDAEDYYQQNHCKQFLPAIEKPALIINALDDPFLPAESYPTTEARNNKFLFLLTPRYGGHVGFTSNGDQHYWIEKTIKAFINDPHIYS